MPVRPEDSSKDSKNTETKSSADNSSPLYQEFFQSLAYSAIQKPYDGITQAVNYCGGDLSQRNLVNAPEAAEMGSAKWIAQQAGAGAATFGEVMLLHRGMRFAGNLIGAQTASSLAITESAMTGRVTAGSLATAGALYEGLVTKSGNNFFGDRLENAALAGSSLYLMGKTQIGLQNLNGVKTLAAHMPEGISGTLGRQMINGASGFLAGAAGGAFSAEAGSFIKQGKFASTSELAEKTFSSAFMGGLLGAVTKPAFENVISSRPTGALPGMHLEQLPGRPNPTSFKADPDVSMLVPRHVAKNDTVSDAASIIAAFRLRTAKLPAELTPAQRVALEPVPDVRPVSSSSGLTRKIDDQHIPGS
ncbi:hypothetical protein BH11CYA1_BH11CYA1_45860 [soil metagenome]